MGKKIHPIKYLDENGELILIYLTLILMMVFIFLQVFLRFSFRSTIDWGEEFSRFCLVWFIYLSCVYAIKKNAHVRVTFFLDLFSPYWRQRVLFLADLIWLLFCAALLVKGIEMVRSMFEFKYISAVLKWNMAFIYTIIPLGFGLMILRLTQTLSAHWRELKGIPRGGVH